MFEKTQCDGIVSLSEDGNYISTYPHEDVIHPEFSHHGKVYDKNGNVVIEGFGSVSADGKRFALLLDTTTIIYSLPDKIVIKEYPIQGTDVVLSSDGRFIVVVGTKTDTASTNNIIVIDSQEDRIWETYASYTNTSPHIFLTKDGKYLLVISYQENKLFYYNLY